ncbi:MAG: glyoxalase superfamily protein [Betaproteobacteria bacterium]
MPTFTKLTPNLVVADVERSLAFYVDLLGFAPGLHVPDAPPYVFASVTGGSVEIFLNLAEAVLKDRPEWAGRTVPSPANSMFIEMEGVDALYDRISARAKVVMPIVTQWYGMREFGIEDPDGHVIIFAERVQQR